MPHPKDAEYYFPTPDGIPQMYYKYELIKFNDGTEVKALCYLSYAKMWCGSSSANDPEFIAKLIKI